MEETVLAWLVFGVLCLGVVGTVVSIGVLIWVACKIVMGPSKRG